MSQRSGSSRGLDQRVLDMGKLVQELEHRFRAADKIAAEGPHASLSLQELKLVEYLGDRGPRMMRELATALQVAVNSITTTVDNLERKQVVVRRRSEEDRRVVHVELTEAGKLVYTSAIEEKLRFLRGMLSALTEEEQEIFSVLMRKMSRGGDAPAGLHA